MADNTTTEVERIRPAAVIEPVHDDGPFAMLMDSNKFAHLQRVAHVFAMSQMVPEHYRGKDAECIIAVENATRLGISTLLYMQNTYIVHGKPGIQAQLATALVNSSGLFTDALDYEIEGDDPFDAKYRVRCVATRKSTGKPVVGPWIDWRLVKGEAWDKKPGSKWLTMPGMMFQYRAAAFFARLHCPERLMGMQTVEELYDVGNAKDVALEEPVRTRTGQLAETVARNVIVDSAPAAVPPETRQSPQKARSAPEGVPTPAPTAPSPAPTTPAPSSVPQEEPPKRRSAARPVPPVKNAAQEAVAAEVARRQAAGQVPPALSQTARAKADAKMLADGIAPAHMTRAQIEAEVAAGRANVAALADFDARNPRDMTPKTDDMFAGVDDANEKPLTAEEEAADPHGDGVPGPF